MLQETMEVLMGKAPNKELIEPRFKESIDRWVENGTPTGSFLEAVLQNNLKEAIGRADFRSLENLPHIVAYLYNDCPADCWGSVGNHKDWALRNL
jgi:hypothetical protein